MSTEHSIPRVNTVQIEEATFVGNLDAPYSGAAFYHKLDKPQEGPQQKGLDRILAWRKARKNKLK